MSNSKYSQWFKIEPGTDYAICKVGKCGAKLSRMGQNSTSLRRHLESVHKEEWKQFEKKEKSVELKRKAEVEKMSANLKRFASSTAGSQSSSKPTAAAATPSVQQVYGNWSPDGPCTKKVHRALTQMIADCNLPLSLIEQAAFKNFCVALQPLYVPPSRDTLTNRYLVELCDEYKRKIANDLKEAKHISLTSDVGTTKNQKHALVSMTAHFIGPDGQPKHCYPSVIPLRVRHTGLAIASVLDDSIEYYKKKYDTDIRDKVHLLVRDDGSSMISAANIVGVDSIQCFAHREQLAIKDGLETLSTLTESGGTIDKIRSIIRKVRKSGVELARLKGFQEEHGLKQHTLQKDMEVRWSSMYKMLEIFVANRAAIEDLLQDGAYPYISAGEWGTMQRLVNVLKPLAIATSSVQGHKAHIGTVLPVFFSLITLLRNGSGGNELEKTRTTIAQSLERRMDGWESNEYLLLATALDPRFKLDQFEADFGEGFVKSMLKDRANALASGLLEPATETETEALDDSDDEPDDPIMKLVAMAKAKEAEPIKKRRPSGVVDAQQKVSVEVETYLSSPTDANADPFAFWHRHRETLPILHGLAMRYLSAPATSAESERLFSTATAIFTHLRQSMTGTTFQKLLFLSRNMGLYGY